MTILEKWKLDHPNQKEIYAIFGDVVQSYCPRHFYDITNIDSCGNGGKHPCEECWNREFPEGIPLKRGQIRKEKIMNYDNTCVNSMPINDCCESGTSRTMIDNLKETTELLHMIEDKLDTIRGSLWFNDGSNPEKDIEIKDMDSNLVHNRDVSKRILKKLDSMVARIGC